MENYLFQTNEAPLLESTLLPQDFQFGLNAPPTFDQNPGPSETNDYHTLMPLLPVSSGNIAQDARLDDFMNHNEASRFQEHSMDHVDMSGIDFHTESPEKPAIIRLTNPIVCTGRSVSKEDRNENDAKPAERKKFSRFREKNYICDLCCRTFTLLQNLANHAFLYHHPRKESARSLRQLSARYKCTKCDKVFHNESRAAAHEKKAHMPPQPHAQVVHNCSECGKVYSSRSLLKEHIVAVHQQRRPYECTQCQQAFGRPGGLRRHVQTVHENVSFSCPYEDCDHPAYKCNKALQAHIRARHTGERPFKCLFCEKAFVRRNDLRVHENTHSIHTKFRCEHCGLTLRREQSFRKHMLRCEAKAMPKIKLNLRSKKKQKSDEDEAGEKLNNGHSPEEDEEEGEKNEEVKEEIDEANSVELSDEKAEESDEPCEEVGDAKSLRIAESDEKPDGTKDGKSKSEEADQPDEKHAEVSLVNSESSDDGRDNINEADIPTDPAVRDNDDDEDEISSEDDDDILDEGDIPTDPAIMPEIPKSIRVEPSSEDEYVDVTTVDGEQEAAQNEPETSQEHKLDSENMKLTTMKFAIKVEEVKNDDDVEECMTSCCRKRPRRKAPKLIPAPVLPPKRSKGRSRRH